ncbi:MAG: L-threonylcarbamoyladenylate synthase [Christensenellales bacterium]
MIYCTETIDLSERMEYGISRASRLIVAGETVVFPTETVYGLGADACSSTAVDRIFRAKGRPADNPLIVHVDSIDMARGVAAVLPEAAQRLMDAFWPGPLTLVLPKSGHIPSKVSAGLPTIAVRMPRHEAALALIGKAGRPIAAPSANLSGSPSPTTAAHAEQDLRGRVPLILDGGPCEVGLESTVLDVSGDRPCLLRPGGVTWEMLEACIGKIEISSGVLCPFDGQAKSPGMKYKHYAPKAKVVLVDGDSVEEIVREICVRYDAEPGKNRAILATRETAAAYGNRIVETLGSRKQPKTIARDFFSVLRRMDEQGVEIIWMETVELAGLGLAIMNRALRSAGFHVVNGREWDRC